jgi:hypothetical protein
MHAIQFWGCIHSALMDACGYYTMENTFPRRCRRHRSRHDYRSSKKRFLGYRLQIHTGQHGLDGIVFQGGAF